MPTKKLHIVLLDNPYPANYGGAIDMWNKIKALHHLGVELTLHCFTYGSRSHFDPLKKFSKQLHLYIRDTQKSNLLSQTPYIVKSRSSKKLLQNLTKDLSPILFEGLHTCAFLNHDYLEKRTKIVRCHNIEHNYYLGLSQVKGISIFKKQFFKMEHKKLKRFEKQLVYADHILGISESDTAHFEQYAPSYYIPAFHNGIKATDDTLQDPYILYQGNLSVEENQNAVLQLIEHVFHDSPMKVVIAGQSPSEKIKHQIRQHQHITLVASPDDEKMNNLIWGATIHLLYSAQKTGVKLKLIHALFSPGHIVINYQLAFNDQCHEQLEVANSWSEMRTKLSQLQNQKVKDRSKLQDTFDNRKNAEKIIELL